MGCSGLRLTRQAQGDLQAAEGAAAEFEAAVVGFGEVGGDGDAEAVAGGALVEAFAAAGDAGADSP